MIKLTPEQCRIIGVMLEKETTTPDQYPLSLNALTSGCNQKSNREPVMSLSESDVQQIVDELVQMKQLSDQGGFGSRVTKYTHRFCNTEFGSLQLSAQQRAIICVLLLRGPQTPGELRTRTQRLADFNDVSEVEQQLLALQDLNGDVLVQKLEREPGKRESRYVHLFTEFDPSMQPANTSDAQDNPSLQQRVEELEQQVATLQKQVQQLLNC